MVGWLYPIPLKPRQAMLTCYPEKIIEAAVVHIPRVSVETQMIRVASTVADSIADELITARRCAIRCLKREVDAYADLMTDRCSIRTPVSMEVDHLNQSVAATLP